PDHLLDQGSAGPRKAGARLESDDASDRVLSGDPVLQRSDRALEVAARDGRDLRPAVSRRLLAVRPAARLVRRGRMTPAIELINVSKAYRRYGGRHFSTLKS